MKNTIKYGSLIAGFLVAATTGVLAEDDKKGPRGQRGPGGGDRTPPKEILEKYDKDGSGDLNEDERQALRADMEKRREEMLAKYDADKDGRLNEEERKKMVLDRFDKDGDGELSDAEKEEARKAMARGGRGGPRGDRGPGKDGPGGKGGPDRKRRPGGDRKPKA